MAASSDAAETFRENVKAMMSLRNLNVTTLADKCGIQRPSLSIILSGKESVTLQRAERIAAGLEVPLSTLLMPKEKFSSVVG